MIDKLENAGLGYYVQSTDTRQKLGNYNLLHYCLGYSTYMP